MKVQFPGERCIQFSCSVLSDSLRPPGMQHARFPCPLPTIRDYSCPLSQWCHSTISILCHPLLLLSSIFPSIRVFPIEEVYCIRWTKYWSFSFSINSSMNIQDWFPLGWTGWISLQSKELSRSSPTPQFKSINSSALSFFYSPTQTSINNYWKKHSFD